MRTTATTPARPSTTISAICVGSVTCGQSFRPGSNRAKYCPACATQARRWQKAASERRRRANRADIPKIRSHSRLGGTH